MKRPEENKKNLIIALEKSLGVVTYACKDVGISRNQFYVYYRTDEDFKLAVDDISNITLDFVEHQLLKSIGEGNQASIAFYMKYKGKSRGYADNLDITSGGEKLTTVINIIKPDGNQF